MWFHADSDILAVGERMAYNVTARWLAYLSLIHLRCIPKTDGDELLLLAKEHRR
jgi:hypothetical protein